MKMKFRQGKSEVGMAGQTIQMNLQLQSNIQQVNQQAQQLNQNLTQAQRTASSMNVGGTTGSRAAASRAAPASARAVDNELNSYGVARGSVGTGAAGRDFAKQSQGLGGLVHVYATFAANIFAVSAAFNALSKSMDTTNMVEGLNQLGAASGRNLGSMAKNISSLTDGAISLRAAMEATAQGSAAGLSGEQMTRMAQVAKTAAQALGRDTADALNRLSRGITKIEPELLDELGIMVKVDRATADYARTLGKTSTSLTEFERRQAFANAVIKQGEEKFGKINIDSNPFTKLEASFFNALQSGGELINKVLGPIAKILSESPTALIGAIGLITTNLLNKAIPAIKGWRDNIKQANEEAKQISQTKVQGIRESKLRKINEARQLKEAQEYALMMQEEQFSKKRMAKSIQNIRSKDIDEITSDDILQIDKYILRNTDKVTGALTKRGIMYQDLKDKIINAQKAHLILTQQEEKAAASSGPLSVESLNKRIANKYRKESFNSNILDKTLEKLDTSGIAASFEYLWKSAERGRKPLGGLNTRMLQLKGTFSILTSYTGKVLSAFSSLFSGLAIGGAVLTLLDTLFSTSAKELEAFSGSLDQADSAVKGLGNTLKYVSTDAFKIENIQAYANALQEVSSATNKIIKDFIQLDTSAGVWDNLKNVVKKIWGGDRDTEAANALSTSIYAAINSLDTPGLQDQLRKSLGLEGVFKKKDINEKVLSLVKDGDYKALNKLGAELDKLAKDESNAASNLTSFNQAAEASIKAVQNLLISFTPTDNMSKFGLEQINMANNLAKSLESPKTKLAALAATFKDVSKSQMFEGNIDANLGKQVIRMESNARQLKEGIQSMQEELNSIGENPTWNKFEKEDRKKLLEENIRNAQAALEHLYSKTSKISTELAATLYSNGADKLKRGVELAMKEGAIQFQKALNQGVGGVAGARIDTSLQLQDISLKRQQIDQTAQLIIAIKEANIRAEIDALEKSKANKGANITEIDKSIGILNRQSYLLKNIDKVFAKDKNNNFIESAEVRAGMGASYSQLMGGQKEKKLLDSQASTAKVMGQRVEVEERYKRASEETDLLIKKNLAEKTSIDNLLKLGIITDENLLKRSKELDLENNKLELTKWEYDYAAKLIPIIFAINNTKEEGAKRELQAQLATLVQEKDKSRELFIQSQLQKDIESDISRANLVLDRTIALRERNLDLVNEEKNAVSSIVKSYTSTLQNAGIISDTDSININKRLDLDKLSIDSAQKLNKLEDDRLRRISELNIRKDKANDTDRESIIKEIKSEEEHFKNKKESLLRIQALQEQQIILQARYQEALAKTEDTMRSIERGASGDYLGTLADNFSDKLTSMIKAAKSAGDTFNQGLISAIDSTIDKFFDAMQKGELTLKGMMQFARNALSDVLRDTASQLMKNTWKEALKGILPATDADKALTEMQKQTSLLQQLVNNTGGTNSYQQALANLTPEEKKQMEQDNEGLALFYGGAELSKTTAEKSEKTTGTFGSFVAKMGEGMGTFIGGLTSNMGVFGKLLGSLGTTLLTFVSQLNFSAAMKGASEGSGFLGGIGGFFKGLFGGGSSSGGFASQAVLDAGYAADPFLSGIFTATAAKGGVFNGSAGLSAYSNSIVTSPTTFAFAKGAGLMGEAGPEAIMPLKRDAQGNLGVRASGGEITNNVSVTVNVTNGSASADVKSGNNMGADLGNAIKAVVTQELIKQTRPGGLLAR